MDKQALLATTRALLECPTAPFHEQAVIAKIAELLTGCLHVTVRLDAFGNLLAEYRRGRGPARYAFAAHMDHPGWVLGPEKTFLGGMPKQYLAGEQGTRGFGPFAMWDLPAWELKEGRIHSRACDDLIGCSAIVAMFQELEARGAECTCLGLFTRAEEVGFIGAIKLARSGKVPKTTTIISLETSSERPPAVMGNGPIIRVGDRSSIFDSAATGTLLAIAGDAKIPTQRCLMSAGSCEATAYQLYGYRCAGITIALGNYHNCGAGDQVAAEFVSLADVQGLVQLCAAIAADTRPLHAAEKALRRELEANVRRYDPYVKATWPGKNEGLFDTPEAAR